MLLLVILQNEKTVLHYFTNLPSIILTDFSFTACYLMTTLRSFPLDKAAGV